MQNPIQQDRKIVPRGGGETVCLTAIALIVAVVAIARVPLNESEQAIVGTWRPDNPPPFNEYRFYSDRRVLKYRYATWSNRSIAGTPLAPPQYEGGGTWLVSNGKLRTHLSIDSPAKDWVSDFWFENPDRLRLPLTTWERQRD